MGKRHWVERHKDIVKAWVKDTWVERHNKDTGPHGYKVTRTELGHKIQSHKVVWVQRYEGARTHGYKDTIRTWDIRTQGHMGTMTQGHNTIGQKGAKTIRSEGSLLLIAFIADSMRSCRMRF